MKHVNHADLDWEAADRGDPPFKRKRLSDAAGGERIGASLYELPPGASSWPYHHHSANEEALYVLSGSGRLRTPEGTVSVEPGEYVSFPATPEGAHRLRAPEDAAEPLRYLVVSTMVDPDVTVYPDSGKFGVYVGAPPGSRDERTLEGYYRIDDDVDYWDGE